MVILNVADYQCRRLEPGNAAQRAEIGFHDVIAIACSPAGRLETLDGLHFHVGGEQVVTAMSFLVSAVDEEIGVKTLAHQASLHVDLDGQHRVDAAGGNGLF